MPEQPSESRDGDRRASNRLSDTDWLKLREIARAMRSNEAQLFRRMLDREHQLEEARQNQKHYKRVMIESLVRWGTTAAIAGALAFLSWTGKLWILAALEAFRDVKP